MRSAAFVTVSQGVADVVATPDVQIVLVDYDIFESGLSDDEFAEAARDYIADVETLPDKGEVGTAKRNALRNLRKILAQQKRRTAEPLSPSNAKLLRHRERIAVTTQTFLDRQGQAAPRARKVHEEITIAVEAYLREMCLANRGRLHRPVSGILRDVAEYYSQVFD